MATEPRTTIKSRFNAQRTNTRPSEKKQTGSFNKQEQQLKRKAIIYYKNIKHPDSDKADA